MKRSGTASQTTDADLIIVGASFAGLTAARTAAMRGLRVIVLEAKPEPGARIHTSGILVREAIEEIDIPSQLTRRVPGVRLYAPNLRSMDLFSPGYAFFTTRTADLMRWMAHEAEAAGATVLCGQRFTGATRENGTYVIEGLGLRTRYLVGADGATSRVARSLGLGQNRRHLVGVEIEFELDDAVDPRFLHCFVDSKIAPGYIAWAAPGPDTIQIGAATTRGRRPDLDAFLARTEGLFGWSRLKEVGRRGGLIPAGGPVGRTHGEGAMLIGDAAGWVSPATGGGIRLAFRWGRRAAALIADHLQSGGPDPGPILAREVPHFRLKRLMRAALDLAPPNAILNLALSTPPMRAFAEWVYFRRRGSDMDRKAFLDWLERQPDGTAERRALPPSGEIVS
ncbi:MAG: NAD(P)/FAD-dependent oxidoreductase [Bauldia sp.]